MSKQKKISRREFIDYTAKGAVGLAGYSMLKSSSSHATEIEVDKSIVVKIHDDNAARIETVEGKKEFSLASADETTQR